MTSIMQNKKIILKNVRVHNLKGVDLSLNPNELIVFTGVSGSGKSSLAFDTIYVEGQRRYIESLSHQTRRYLADLPKPDAESISGLSPTIAIEQKLSVKTPRSTVGTLTGIYDFLRVLYAKIGIPHCPVSKEPVEAISQEKIVAQIQNFPLNSKLIFLAPFAKGKKGEFKEEFKELLSKGFMRLRVDGAWVELGQIEELDGTINHDIDIVVDRLVLDQKALARVKEAVQLSLELGNGFFTVYDSEEEKETLFSQNAYSKTSNLSYGPLFPHDFSFNHPLGMCPTCHGLGIASDFDLTKIINPDLSIAEDCCLVASSYATIRYGNIYNNLARLFKFDLHKPWKNLSEEAKRVFLFGVEQKWTRMKFVHPEKDTSWVEFIRWRGVLHEAKEKLIAAKSDAYRKKMNELMCQGVCPSCLGSRIKPYPAETQLGGKKISEITAMPLSEAFEFFENLKLSSIERQIGEEIIKEIKERIRFLIDVGLKYLSIDRTSPTLSGGESQRVRLASQIGAGLVGAIYVLDEPSIGLHPADHHKLIKTLFRLRDQGNTVIVVEHDTDTILSADTVVDVGPGAGSHGGEILFCGPAEKLLKEPRSLTGGYLSGRLKLKAPKIKRPISEKKITLFGASHHNLKNIDISFPLGVLTCITGLSGSGKSSLITDTLYPILANHFHQAKLKIGSHKKIEGLEFIDKIIAVDQSPIGRTPRSNAATYIKLFDEIRDLFTQLPESQMRGLHAGHFSFNVKEGSCPYCEGLGSVKIDMDFMEDAWVECPQCKGKRFDKEVLAIQFKGKNIADILNMDVEHALELFAAIPSIYRKLELLSQVGLNYLTLGQPSTTLSGGEAQRIKLAKELIRPSSGKTIYIFDEPTTGLHFHDIGNLTAILQRLVDKGNTVIVVEHNLDLIKMADWIVDLGPGAGIEGGKVVGEGPPEKIQKLNTPTGQALKGIPLHKEKNKNLEKEDTKIVIENASQNNLKDISLSIPRGKITVFTGPSGSGKSSLVFETLYAEGQRRYTETLPAYSRALVKQLPKPKVDVIEGLSPAIALEQKTGGLNPRSTVGTLTEIYDLLRVLYAHLGVAYCPEPGEEIKHISKEFVAKKTMALGEGEKIHVLAPLQTAKGQTFEELLEQLSKAGYLRIRLNQVIYEIDEKIPFEKQRKNELYLIIDRLLSDKKNEKRIFEAIEKAVQFSDGTVVIATEKKDHYFNLSFAVESTGQSYPPITPQTFSFNHDAGMCLECQGLGMTYGAHLSSDKRVLRLSLLDLMEKILKEKGTDSAYELIEYYFSSQKMDPKEPLKNWNESSLAILFSGGPEITSKKWGSLSWKGIHHLLAHAVRMAHLEIKESLLPLMSASTCPSCKGDRLNPLSRNVRINNLSISDFCRLNLKEAHSFMKKIALSDHSFLKETHLQICKQLEFLLSIGLDYISCDRSAPTLSGGELQRIRLARQLGSGLTSCLYLLDEPTIGLHPHNNERLNQALKNLCALGNTVVLVEHDPMTLQIADYLFDFGPKAGKEGGRITAEGTLKEILKDPHSLTGAYLSGRKKIAVPKKRRPLSFDIKIKNAKLHNLKNISVDFPKSAITCLTGVSGSGKSTLIRHILKPAAEKAVNSRKKLEPVEYLGASIQGLSDFTRVICVDQSPIGQTARADVSTYTEIMPLIRSLFASLPLSASKGLQPRHFSPNHLRGMCRTCWGMGYKTIDLQFLPSVRLVCETCKGQRLNAISLEVKYKEKNIGQILQLNIDEAIQWFSAIPKIVKKLQTLQAVGLSYLQLGQEVVSLSGGEAQRLRLSRELSKREAGTTLYLIDEPTVGLHSEDIAKLLPIFHQLAAKKNTLLIIEHNLDVIANADYVVDMGPDAGDLGGEVVAKGTPEEIALSKTSKTAPYLKSHLYRD
jgi:excinuclease ABC subunit A